PAGLASASWLYVLGHGRRLGDAGVVARLGLAGPVVCDLAAAARGPVREPTALRRLPCAHRVHARDRGADLTGGEFALIEAIRARLGRHSDRVLRALGDDAAVVKADGLVVTSVAAFVEGVPVRLATTSLR